MHSSALQQGSEQTQKLMKTRIFEEIKHCTYQNVEEFFFKFLSIYCNFRLFLKWFNRLLLDFVIIFSVKILEFDEQSWLCQFSLEVKSRSEMLPSEISDLLYTW